jgi:hypothetical protein
MIHLLKYALSGIFLKKIGIALSVLFGIKLSRVLSGNGSFA